MFQRNWETLVKQTHRPAGQTSIRMCPNIACKHPFQDERYGARMRVHNHAALKGSEPPSQDACCTACGTKTTL